MKVLVETNFVLELAFGRDKFASCRELVDMAERGEIELFIPAYSFIEPYESVIRRQKSRRELRDRVLRELNDITRSVRFEAEATGLAQLAPLLVGVGETEQEELHNVLTRLLAVAAVVELNAEIIGQSLGLQEDFTLSPQDALVFASVLHALAQHDGPACFVTTNSKDFSAPNIAQMLDAYQCKLMFDFERGLGYVRNFLATAEPDSPA